MDDRNQTHPDKLTLFEKELLNYRLTKREYIKFIHDALDRKDYTTARAYGKALDNLMNPRIELIIYRGEVNYWDILYLIIKDYPVKAFAKSFGYTRTKFSEEFGEMIEKQKLMANSGIYDWDINEMFEAIDRGCRSH